MLKAENMSIGYGGKHTIFSGISFSAAEGQMIALLGVNGIGKSTLLRTLSGLQPRISGTLVFDDKEIQDLSVAEKARLISVVLTERIMIDNITVQDLIALGRTPYTGWLGNMSEEDKTAIEQVIRVMKIEKLRYRFFNELSDGEKQKTLIARALCQQTPVMILDEPTAFLDFRNKRDILELMHTVCRNLKKLIIFSTHDIETSLDYCDKAWILTEDKQFREMEKTDNLKEKVKQILLMPVSGS